MNQKVVTQNSITGDKYFMNANYEGIIFSTILLFSKLGVNKIFAHFSTIEKCCENSSLQSIKAILLNVYYNGVGNKYFYEIRCTVALYNTTLEH
jgi:hypothetical protein